MTCGVIPFTKIISKPNEKMVCPLRYIVAGVSILVAFAVLLWTSSTNNQLKDDRRKGMRTQAKVQQRKSALSKFVDLFTGRYLMDKWQEFKSMESSSNGNSVSSTTVKLMAD